MEEHTSAMFRAQLAQAVDEKHAGLTSVILSICSLNKEPQRMPKISSIHKRANSNFGLALFDSIHKEKFK